MKKYLISSVFFVSMMSLIGCSDSTPECDSDDAKRIVIEIAQDEIKVIDWLDEIPGGSFEVVNIRSLSHNKKDDLYTCVADLNYTVHDDLTILPITYTVQSTQDGDGTFYVEVFGL